MILLKTFSSLILALVISLIIASQSVHGLSREDAWKMINQVFDPIKQNSSFLDGSFDLKKEEMSIYDTKFHGWSNVKLVGPFNAYKLGDNVYGVYFSLELPTSKVTGTCSFGTNRARITLLSYQKTNFKVRLMVNTVYKDVILERIESLPSDYFSRIDCSTDYDCRPYVEEVNGSGSYFHEKMLGKIFSCHAFSNVMYEPSNTTFI